MGVSQKLGGISPEMTKALMQIKDSSVSLHDAAKRGDLQRLQEFVKDGKDVNGKDFKGVTPLGYAVGHDQLSCVKVLIDMKANLQGMAPMAVAQQNNQQQAMALLQRHGAK